MFATVSCCLQDRKELARHKANELGHAFSHGSIGFPMAFHVVTTRFQSGFERFNK